MLSTSRTSRNRSVQVQYESFNYPALMKEFKGSSLLIDMVPNLQLQADAIVNKLDQGTSASMPIAFDNFYFYHRHLRNTPGCSLVHIHQHHHHMNEPLNQFQFKKLKSFEQELNYKISDVAKIDQQHMIIAKEHEIDIWKISNDSKAFLLQNDESNQKMMELNQNENMDEVPMKSFLPSFQNAVNIWQNEKPVHLIAPSTLPDNHCLVADSDGVQVIRLGTPSQKVCSFQETDTVSSIKWHENENIFSSTLDEGMIKIYDMRSKVNVAAQFVHRGLFDHVVMANQQVNQQQASQKHCLACGGLGGIIHVYDDRKLGQALVQHKDCFLQEIFVMSSSDSGDLVACGRNGFSLYKSLPTSQKLSFREYQKNHCPIGACFKPNNVKYSNQMIISTDAGGMFREFSMKEFKETDQMMKPSHHSISPRYRNENHSVGMNSPNQSDGVPNRGDYVHPSCSSVAVQDSIFENHTGDWDWDIDFWSDKDGMGSGSNTPSSSSSFEQGTTVPSPRVRSLSQPADPPSNGVHEPKEIDELIGYYFS